VTVILDNPLNQNRTLKPEHALKLGIADELLDSADFLAESLRWAARVLRGEVAVDRSAVDRGPAWDEAVARGRALADAKLHGAAPAPYRALDLIALAKDADLDAGSAAEVDALADLVLGDELRAGLYSFDLVQKRARRPVGVPDKALARPVTKVGVVGAGLMAGQLALLFARRLQVPVVLTDLDQDRLDRGVAYVHGEIDALLGQEAGRAGRGEPAQGLVTGSLTKDAFADAEFVIEAVFEELTVKKQVLAEVGGRRPAGLRAGDQHLLAVGHRDGRGPGAPGAGGRLPLLQPGRGAAAGRGGPRGADRRPDAGDGVRGRQGAEEVVRAGEGRARVRGEPAAHPVPRRGDRRRWTRARRWPSRTGRCSRWGCRCRRSRCSRSSDRRSRCTWARRCTRRTRAVRGEREPRPARRGRQAGRARWGPSGPEVDPEVAGAVRGRRPAVHRGAGAGARAGGAGRGVQDLLDEGVVAQPQDVDLCMLLGAGWPFHLGGILPYLDRVGVSERVSGGRFLPPGVASVG
jgi:hypothetical protein